MPYKEGVPIRRQFLIAGLADPTFKKVMHDLEVETRQVVQCKAFKLAKCINMNYLLHNIKLQTIL